MLCTEFIMDDTGKVSEVKVTQHNRIFIARKK